MMQHYRDSKAAAPGSLVMFRMGDFYELFGDDAIVAAKALGLAVTRSSKDTEWPMTGFPYHQLEAYLRKLIAAGHRVSIAGTE